MALRGSRGGVTNRPHRPHTWPLRLLGALVACSVVEPLEFVPPVG